MLTTLNNQSSYFFHIQCIVLFFFSGALKKSTTASVETVETTEIELGNPNKDFRKFSRSTSMDNNPAESVIVTSPSRDNLHRMTANGELFESNKNQDIKYINSSDAVICTRYTTQESPQLERKVGRQVKSYF